MVALGKVYRGRMVDVLATNHKLRDRARRIVAAVTGVKDRAAQALLRQAGGRAKLAIAIHELGLPAAEAARRLAAAGDDLHRLLDGDGATATTAKGAVATKKRRRPSRGRAARPRAD
jgi:N-acetylmuramic acid 6-phosphate etherase